MKPKRTGPSVDNIFWFDAGRSYQAGLSCSLSKVKMLLLQEFIVHCRLILVRYLDANRQDTIAELYKAFIEGYERGETFKEEGLKTMKCSGEFA